MLTLQHEEDEEDKAGIIRIKKQKKKKTVTKCSLFVM
jgi:hypothetical protein